MEENKEPIVTVNKVLGIIIGVFSFLAALSLIWACAKQKRPSAGGFVWQYA